MLTAVRLFLFLLLLTLATWSLVGIFDDSIVLFKFLNFFGQLIPFISITLGAMLFWLLRTSNLKWATVFVCIPSTVIPILVPNLNLYTGLETPQSLLVGEHQFTFITFSKMSHNTNYAEVAKVIDCTRFDVIHVQEIRDIDVFLNVAPSVTKHCHYAEHPEKPTLFTFSKYPLKVSSVQGNTFIETVIANQSIALINVHALKTITRSADSQTNLAKRMEDLKQAIKMPIIVAGDFNATPFNESIMLMRKQFQEVRLSNSLAARRSTWPGEVRRLGSLGPLLHIDHIFYEGLSSHNTFIHASSYGSDHYPIQTTFSLNGKG